MQQIDPDRHHPCPMTVECASQGGYSDSDDADRLLHPIMRDIARGCAVGCCGDADGIADYELVEYLLALAIPRRDTKPLAKGAAARIRLAGTACQCRS
jgi:hypothetical protein